MKISSRAPVCQRRQADTSKRISRSISIEDSSKISKIDRLVTNFKQVKTAREHLLEERQKAGRPKAINWKAKKANPVKRRCTGWRDVCRCSLRQPTSAEHSSVNDTCHLLLSTLQPFVFVRMIYVGIAAANRRYSGREFGWILLNSRERWWMLANSVLRKTAGEMFLWKMNAFVRNTEWNTGEYWRMP